MEEQRAIAVSPRHQVRLASEYLPLLDRPPARDFVVHVIENRQANGLPLMLAELVIAGYETRQQFPLAQTYPLHFRKTYFTARLHSDPREEFAHAKQASALFTRLPAPIGSTQTELRCCFIPGRTYSNVTPFQPESEDANLRCTRDLPLATAAGLWRLLEEAFLMLRALHTGGLSHGDAQLSNFIVSPAPLEVLLVDFEASLSREQTDSGTWTKRCASDLEPLLHEALLLQASLGRQPGELAELSFAAADRLFRDPQRLLRYVERGEAVS
jgi:hypothetical protein